MAAIDAANAADPRTVTVDGSPRPLEVVHAERVTHWLSVLAPDADDAQRLAARAHHLRRWTLPRADFPDGWAGYLRWRSEQKKRHARDVGDLLADCGYEPDVIERVQAIVAKQGLGTDPAVQTHEDALCLVFLELQFDELAERLGDDRTVDVLRRTTAKMSAAGLAAAGGVALSSHGQALLARATAAPA